jgi:VanZ family protein
VRVPVLPRPVRYAGALGVAAVLLWASVIRPPATDPGGQPFVLFGVPGDKWLHAVAYAGLAGALAYARLAERRDLLVVAFVAVAYGLAIEGVQAPLAYRAFSLADAAANAVGATVGAALWTRVRPLAVR